jgi:hypothetical protein
MNQRYVSRTHVRSNAYEVKTSSKKYVILIPYFRDPLGVVELRTGVGMQLCDYIFRVRLLAIRDSMERMAPEVKVGLTPLA